VAKGLGITKVKITGGEPLLRNDILGIVRAAATSGMDDVSMTTNGTKLAGIASQLADAGLNRINISLDTLDPIKYKQITGAPMLDAVLRGIKAAVESGLRPVKINMVVLRGVNENEVDRMIDFVRGTETILQLIELVDFLPTGADYARYHHDLRDIEEALREKADRVIVREDMHARPKYFVDGAEIEIVRPMHNSRFCAHCRRIRLTPDGKLKPCLLRDDNLVDLSDALSGSTQKMVESFLRAIYYREPYFK